MSMATADVAAGEGVAARLRGEARRREWAGRGAQTTADRGSATVATGAHRPWRRMRNRAAAWAWEGQRGPAGVAVELEGCGAY